MGCNSQTSKKVEETSNNVPLKEESLKEDTSKEKTSKEDTSEEETSKEEKSELYELMELLGKNDKEASSLLGGGKENKTEDGEYLIGRIYESQIYDEDVTVYTVYTGYDNDEKVNTITLDLTKKDASYYKELVSKDLEQEPVVDSESSESGATIYTWILKDKIVSLYDSAGLISLEMVLIE